MALTVQQVFCCTGLPLASTRWSWSKFSSHCPLSTNLSQPGDIDNYSSWIFLGMMGIEPRARVSRCKHANSWGRHSTGFFFSPLFRNAPPASPPGPGTSKGGCSTSTTSCRKCPTSTWRTQSSRNTSMQVFLQYKSRFYIPNVTKKWQGWEFIFLNHFFSSPNVSLLSLFCRTQPS